MGFGIFDFSYFFPYFLYHFIFNIFFLYLIHFSIFFQLIFSIVLNLFLLLFHLFDILCLILIIHFLSKLAYKIINLLCTCQEHQNLPLWKIQMNLYTFFDSLSEIIIWSSFLMENSNWKCPCINLYNVNILRK